MCKTICKYSYSHPKEYEGGRNEADGDDEVDAHVKM